jgi:hypothetical protein
MLSHMKRTTLVIPSSLYLQLKQRAATEGRTLSDVVEQALRLGLETLASPRRSRVTLPSYDLGPFLLDPASRATWSEALERAEGPEEAR